jgi:hypothetical protein
MKRNIFLVCLGVWVLPVLAADPQTRFDASGTVRDSTGWDTSHEHWDRVLSEKRDSGLRLGKSDFVVEGPLIEGFRRERFSTDRTVGQRFLGLPVVRLFVPTRMPSTPGGTGKYFAWGESNRPWAAVAQGTPAGNGFDRNDGPRNSLITVNY